MLLLGRRQYQSIYIGEHIILKVMKIEQNTVQIGIEAPSNVLILREELVPYDETKKLKKMNRNENLCNPD